MLLPCPTFVGSQDVQGEVVCAKQRKECFLREVRFPPKGMNVLRQNDPSWRDLDGSVVYLKLSDFLLGSVLPNSKCYIIEISS